MSGALSTVGAFPPQARPAARALTSRLLSQLAEAQQTVDQLLAESYNATEAEILLGGPALLASIIADDLESAIWRVGHSTRAQLAADRAIARLIAYPDREELAA